MRISTPPVCVTPAPWSDPIPTNWRPVLCRGVSLEDPTASLDDRCRAGVVFVTDDQQPLDPLPMPQVDGLAKDLRGVAPTPECGQHAVPDMTALPGQPLVELETNGYPTDEVPIDDRGQQGGSDPVRRNVDSGADPLRFQNPFRPRHPPGVAEEEGEALGDEGIVGGQGGSLITSFKWS